MIEKMFREFGASKNTGLNNTERRELFYCLINTTGLYDHMPIEEYEERILEIFEIILSNNGDINQFSCGIILALFGVPIILSNPIDDIKSIIQEFKRRDIPLGVIAERDYAIYTTIGSDRRKFVTALSSKLFADSIAIGKMTVGLSLGSAFMEWVPEVNCTGDSGLHGG